MFGMSNFGMEELRHQTLTSAQSSNGMSLLMIYLDRFQASEIIQTAIDFSMSSIKHRD